MNNNNMVDVEKLKLSLALARAPTFKTGECEMLVLTRRVGERLIIGDDIYVAVLGINGSQVKVGIVAPKNIPVHREEVYQKIQEKEGRECQSNIYLPQSWGV